jgi:hypothetical protein
MCYVPISTHPNLQVLANLHVGGGHIVLVTFALEGGRDGVRVGYNYCVDMQAVVYSVPLMPYLKLQRQHALEYAVLYCVLQCTERVLCLALI